MKAALPAILALALAAPAFAQTTAPSPAVAPAPSTESVSPVAAQAPSSGEAALPEAVQEARLDLRVVISSLRSARPNFADMEPELAASIEKQQGPLKTVLSGLGPVQEVEYVGDRLGAYQFHVQFENGAGAWFIARGEDGKLKTLVFRRIDGATDR